MSAADPADAPAPKFWPWIPGTLLVGAVGSVIFAFFALPLAWMLGAMTTTTAGSMAGLPLRVWPRFRLIMTTILGVMLGSVFKPDLFDRVGAWGAMLVSLLVFLAIVTALGFLYCRHVAKYDRPTSFFSCAPGGLNEMVLVGPRYGADMRTVAMMHGSRILFVVMTLPAVLSLILGGIDGQGSLPGSNEIPGLFDIAVLSACAVVGLYGGRAIRMPAAQLMGPMMLSGGVHLLGITEAPPPQILVILAQIVIGSAIGSRFAGTPPAFLRRILIRSFGMTVVILGATFLAATAVSEVTGIAWEACVLALTPGGVAEMSLIALALDIDPAFVSFHHLARIVIIVMFLPLIYRLVTGRRPIDPLE